MSVLIPSCDRNKKNITRFDTVSSGNTMIVCDESFAPIIQEEIAVFTGLNRAAYITPVYTSEKDVFKLLLSDSIRLAIAARDISEKESDYLKGLKLIPRSQRIALDGIALIINRENPDSLISLSDLKKIMTGNIKCWNEIQSSKITKSNRITVVFDNKSSSNLRFIQDSICGKIGVSSDIYAASSSKDVLNFVAKNPYALGIIGVNWISNPNDSTKLSFDNSIRVMSVSRSLHPTIENSFKPFPAFIATGDYPLTRDVYVILTDLRGSLSAGFVSFIAGDSGQRIILKAGLVPATRPTRLINLKNDFEY